MGPPRLHILPMMDFYLNFFYESFFYLSLDLKIITIYN